MVHIWKSLVADSKKTIDENLDLIIDDLLVQCGSRLWRSREASCLALADIIQGRKFYEVIKINFVLLEFREHAQSSQWTILFKKNHKSYSKSPTRRGTGEY